ncbi:filamentous hemagglutinin N-terminal domain-containing protein [Acaryochloris sp. IP29b_bin.148]|uniref:two-partner secretion domain-containing protein n=1 Tax=Acaryochloris sp. IP29b_bin.148 TaxID=2969218 RepID=UPI002607E833|nr:filamentous hemagglutinin N-terminal domain-containing protein [Acaryochloris sp. IP29b_bin.148]
MKSVGSLFADLVQYQSKKASIDVFCLPSFLTLICISSTLNPLPAQAQPIQADDTLGRSQSVVKPIDALRDRIEGGATRGGNLFHSFEAFNVDGGRSVYFANPSGIDNILSRVTGRTPSHILGRLGVLGKANLFLLNPNGFVFGPQASLDIQGSFYVSTADAIPFKGDGEFSATHPGDSQLLSVDPKASFLNHAAIHQGSITHQGTLRVGNHLTFTANDINVEGQIFTGGDLNLNAAHTLTAQDQISQPAILSAGRHLQLQGNQAIDLFAIRHPDSGLFSGGDMVLRSAHPVGGDAHYFSGGHFRIEQLDSTLGDLTSPYDPVIRASGDVVLNAFTGASLHIFAGGSVAIPGGVTIVQPDSTANAIIETVTLSDQTTNIAIDGSLVPTLDIRAGTTAIGTSPFNTGQPTGADITIGPVLLNPTVSTGGQVFLTNQYRPNPALAGTPGTITVDSIETADFLGGGAVVIDSRGAVNLTGSVTASSKDLFDPSVNIPRNTFFGNGGNIVALAAGDITVSPDANILSFGLSGGDIRLESLRDISVLGSQIANSSWNNTLSTPGGDIAIQAQRFSLENGSTIFADANFSSTSQFSHAGAIRIDAQTIALSGTDQGFGSGIFNQISSGAIGSTQGITISAGTLDLDDGARLSTTVFGQGNSGSISIQADDISLAGTNIAEGPSALQSEVAIQGSGSAGGIQIQTDSLLLNDGAQILADIRGNGESGPITIQARQSFSLMGNSRQGDGSLISSQIESTGTGTSGDIEIASARLILQDGAGIIAGTLGNGNGSNITIAVDDSVALSGISRQQRSNFITSSVGPNAIGQGGDIAISARSLVLEDGAGIGSVTAGTGNAGKVSIETQDGLTLIGENSSAPRGVSSITSSVEQGAKGSAAGIEIKAGTLSLTEGTQIFTTTLGAGDAGGISIDTTDGIILSGMNRNGLGSVISSSVGPTAEGTAGPISLLTNELILNNGALISSGTSSTGNAAPIQVNAPLITLDKQSAITTLTVGQGDAGPIQIDETDTLLLNNSVILSGTTTASTGDGSNIQIQADNVSLTNRSLISASSQGKGRAGNILIFPNHPYRNETITLDNSDITTAAAQSTGGAITLTTSDLRLLGDSDILTNVASGAGTGGDITLSAQSILAFDDSDILAFARDGTGGDIVLNSPIFFGESFALTEADPNTLDGNNRVDINATGGIASGAVAIPDVSFVQNNLTDLPENLVNTEQLLANSCLVPATTQQGKFIITGSGGLPRRPGEAASSDFPTGSVRSTAKRENAPTQGSKRPWQIGDPVIEAQGAYPLQNGQLVMSRICSDP